MKYKGIPFGWTLLITTGDATEDNITNGLLTHAIELWLTIRGNSCAGDWQSVTNLFWFIPTITQC